MSATIVAIVALAALVCGWAAWDVIRALRISKRFRGERVVTCPETGCPAAVTIDVRHALASGLVEHAPRIRLQSCSRWNERGRCDGPCVEEAAAPASTTRAIVDRAIRGKSCAFCGKIIERTASLNHYAAFLLADRTTVEWPDVAPERLRETIAVSAPVCWDCHIAETFRRRYPELVTDRPWRRA
jgi:hypothetical protein